MIWSIKNSNQNSKVVISVYGIIFCDLVKVFSYVYVSQDIVLYTVALLFHSNTPYNPLHIYLAPTDQQMADYYMHLVRPNNTTCWR